MYPQQTRGEESLGKLLRVFKDLYKLGSEGKRAKIT